MAVPRYDQSFRAAACLLVLAVAVLTWPRLSHAEGGGVGAADRAAIVAVIGAQMDAFQRNDAARAFSFAAPSIQSKFGDAATFMRMVAMGYAPVFRPRQVEFLDALDHQRGILQRVWIRGPDGKPVIAIYTMGRMEDGNWRIRGVELVEPDGAGV